MRCPQQSHGKHDSAPPGIIFLGAKDSGRVKNSWSFIGCNDDEKLGLSHSITFGFSEWVVPDCIGRIAGRRGRMNAQSAARGLAMFIELFILVVLVAVVIIALRPPRK
ncbi:MAG: hypothetical protein COV51_00820 [Gallionellaceae bacterium CG11_big_fil_rev_8_21_14_0_20_60_62]|nr:MAG: hypothetical protein COV51_00820 [Gallionellaceae bacterium CG11_big_fil_rev_8_21_14_0_20_60_62]